VIDPINRGTVYVVTGLSGVWKSTNGGDSWQMASAGLPDTFIVYYWAIDPQSPNTVYAAGIWRNNRPDAVFKSLDGEQAGRRRMRDCLRPTAGSLLAG
jgi:hypothetical protein